MRTFIKYNRNALLWAFLILGLCSMPVKGIPQFQLLNLFSLDKVAHMLMFGVQCWLLARGLSRYKLSFKAKYAGAIAFVVTTIYGALIEMMQGYLLSGRTMDFVDAIANLLGALIGWLAFIIVNRASQKKAI